MVIAIMLFISTAVALAGPLSPHGVKPRAKAGVKNCDTVKLEPVDVFERRGTESRITRMPDVGAGVINATKKAERIYIEDVPMIPATSTARQAFSSVAGINVWESDQSGLQLGIGARGLSPNRMINFNARQNGYDISADPLGYPEAYYTPLLMAVDHIDVVRGAGSLRYGSQFGGTINFIMKEGSRTSPLAGLASVSGGSYGFASGYVEVGGTTGATNYIGIAQYRQADAWRRNSNFQQRFGYAAIGHQFTPALKIKLDATVMNYLSHQPGGLTDSAFAADARSSVRARNWMGIDWNMASATIDWQAATRLRLQSITFFNSSSRLSVGNNQSVTNLDNDAARVVIDDRYENLGNETTLRYDDSLSAMPFSLLTGLRAYTGRSSRAQGLGSAGSSPDFTLRNHLNADGFDMQHPNSNLAGFSEMVLHLSPLLKIVPGVRYDHIVTAASGTYRRKITDTAGIVSWEAVPVDQDRRRSILLAGLGASYTIPETAHEIYANVSQNYRSVNFSDLRITSPTLVVDSNLRDGSGYTMDLGFRGSLQNILTWDVSLFAIEYRNRIGEVSRVNEQGETFRLRTNLASSYSRGIEWLHDLNVSRMIGMTEQLPMISWLLNATLLQSGYRSVDNPAIDGKRLEYAPDVNLRTGLSASWKGLRGSLLMTHVSKQYADAANREFDRNAASGVVPAYTVYDLNLGYAFDRYRFDVAVNNLLDTRYFTRRADGYPGPGIIPAEPLSVNASISLTL